MAMKKYTKKRTFNSGKKNEKGAALVEYGMLVGLIAVLAIVAVLNLGGTVRDTFTQVSQTLSTSLASATAGVAGAGAENVPSVPEPAHFYDVTITTVADFDSSLSSGWFNTTGAATVNEQTTGSLYGFYSQDNAIIFHITGGDYRDLFDDAEIVCDGDSAGALQTQGYLSGSDRSYFIFDNGDISRFTLGSQPECTITVM
jgi:pilus assembly protein Flp/PilA